MMEFPELVQWTGFCMIGTSVMKELKCQSTSVDYLFYLSH